MIKSIMHDSHIHLAMQPLQNNLDEVIKNFKDLNGKYILTQSTDTNDINETIDISKRYPDIIDLALGLHPTIFEEYTVLKGNTKTIYEQSMKYISEYEVALEKNISAVKAIGETGLDYYQFAQEGEYKDMLVEIQKISFRKHLQLALKHNLPVSVHARDIQGNNQAVLDCLTIIAEEGKGVLRGSFHSYTGDIKYVQDILDIGFHIGFNAIITYNSGKSVREILKKTPQDRILFETDGPFLPPQSVRKNKDIKDKYAQPSSVREIMETASEIKQIDINKLEEITDNNYELLFHRDIG